MFRRINREENPEWNRSVPFVKWWRLDAKAAEVYVPLPTMMDLVVDHVEQQVGRAALVLTERLDGLVEALRWNLLPQRVELVGAPPGSNGLAVRGGLVGPQAGARGVALDPAQESVLRQPGGPNGPVSVGLEP